MQAKFARGLSRRVKAAAVLSIIIIYSNNGSPHFLCNAFATNLLSPFVRIVWSLPFKVEVMITDVLTSRGPATIHVAPSNSGYAICMNSQSEAASGCAFVFRFFHRWHADADNWPTIISDNLAPWRHIVITMA